MSLVISFASVSFFWHYSGRWSAHITSLLLEVFFLFSAQPLLTPEKRKSSSLLLDMDENSASPLAPSYTTWLVETWVLPIAPSWDIGGWSLITAGQPWGPDALLDFLWQHLSVRGHASRPGDGGSLDSPVSLYQGWEVGPKLLFFPLWYLAKVAQW